MLLGLLLLIVGAVLVINGLWLLGRLGDREVVFMNTFGGFIALCVALFFAFGPGADNTSISSGALVLLFAATYLWIAYNRAYQADGRGLGWFCLFVALTLGVVAVKSFGAGPQGGLALWMAVNWSLWAILWFTLFLLLALGKSIGRPVGIFCALVGVVTAWIPGFQILQGNLS